MTALASGVKSGTRRIITARSVLSYAGSYAGAI
jgi:hypothetical protein